MWFLWSEIDKFGVIESELTEKAYQTCQISRKCFGKIFASLLKFMIFLRPGTEPKNGIMWFPWSEIEKFGVILSELTGKAYHKCQISRKCFGKICIDS